MWSFLGNKDNKQWILLAIDASSKEIVGVYIGKRDQPAAQGLWDYLPPVYRQGAVSYTNFWSAYKTVFPQKRSKAVGKETGLTNSIERFNNTMRQKISKFGRKTLSFSKRLSNYIGLFGILFMSITPVYLLIKIGSSVLTAAQMLINSSQTSFSGIKYEKVNDKYTKFTWRDSRRLQTDSRNIDFSSKITNKNSKLPSVRSM